MKKSYIIILLVILIGISLVNVAWGFFTGGGKEEVQIDREQFEHVEIDTTNADIQIHVTDSRPYVELVNKQKYDLQVEVKGKSLDIEVDEPWFNWFSFDFSFRTPKLNVYLPKEMYETIEVKTNNGKIDVNGLEVKELNTETNNGRIVVKDVISSTIYTDSNNGKVILENITGKIIGETHNGDIIITKDVIDQPMELETHNGDVTVQTKKEPENVTYHFKTHNGEVTVFGSEYFNPVVGNGENLIQLRTHNGNITVKKQ
ncbi:DUF4097 family beta strand repeat-containing protein [Ureibacillus acetophenoni]|uniref:Putative adhesin n=1 Tax=Ureibacillus acetophenoni TaxID=614649 RepID=A0A285UFU8_9BACL|nr:DUF4097 family beta strand repeat-containing protein [Ureibacillus acetophenoni]SOC40709.1 putative adhesin [Ureibacillus acetophenoni]